MIVHVKSTVVQCIVVDNGDSSELTYELAGNLSEKYIRARLAKMGLKAGSYLIEGYNVIDSKYDISLAAITEYGTLVEDIPTENEEN